MYNDFNLIIVGTHSAVVFDTVVPEATGGKLSLYNDSQTKK